MPPSCLGCNTFGHLDKVGPEKYQPNEKSVQVWKVKETVTSSSEFGESSKAKKGSGEADLEKGSVHVDDPVNQSLNSLNICEKAIDDPIDIEFPSLQDSMKKKGKGRGRGAKSVSLAGSTNKIETLVECPIASEVRRQPRVASQGVANLLQELHGKKK
ncbi:hypothetical protein V6N11_010559 [Hibiscus sabdariffa]|uniref:Uncharacterized protein n=1 Tax=Hibiscus sabdariffa TaxID=183260 RepID=A0ABR2S6J5_9ROSI